MDHAWAWREPRTSQSSAAKSAPKSPDDESYVNTVGAVAIAPSGVGEELDEYVAEVVRAIRESGLPNETNAMFTNLEGDLDDVLRTVRDAAMVLASEGHRTQVTLKLDIRPSFRGQLAEKVAKVNRLLG
ncbi:thiamine-binding protein [Bifidobacterium choloepi]